MVRKKYRKKRKYKRKYKRKIRGRGLFGDAFRTLGGFDKLWYKSFGGKWDEKKLCNGKTKCTKKSKLS